MSLSSIQSSLKVLSRNLQFCLSVHHINSPHLLFLNGDGAQHQLGLARSAFFLRLVRVGVLFELIQSDAHLSIHLSPDCLLSKLPISTRPKGTMQRQRPLIFYEASVYTMLYLRYCLAFPSHRVSHHTLGALPKDQLCGVIMRYIPESLR